MNEKKQRIIETGMKLFATKGFHSTSIQQIADQSGVSKGAFYLHFSSKEDLTLQIHHYYYNDLVERVAEVRKLDLSPKESLARQVQVYIEAFQSNKEFIIMHMRDNVDIKSEANSFMMEMRKQTFKWSNDNLLNIYGDALMPKIVDASILFEGMMQSYFKWLVIDNLPLDSERLAHFIVRRVDDAIKGMMEESDAPQISRDQVESISMGVSTPSEERTVQDQLRDMKEKVARLSLHKTRIDELTHALDIIEAEANKEKPERVVIQGMLAHFKNLPEMEQDCQEIADHLNISLL